MNRPMMTNPKKTRTTPSQRGFSLIEALFAMALISIVVASIAPVFVSYTNVNRQTEIRSDATLVGERLLDDLRRQPITNWPASGTVQTTVLAGRTYTTVLTHKLFNSETSSNLTEVEVEVILNDKTYFSAESIFTNLSGS